MNPIKSLYGYLETAVIENASAKTLRVAAFLKNEKAISKLLEYEAESMQKQTLRDWTNAIAAATDPEFPDFTALFKLYKNLNLDNHLASIIDSRILFCQRSEYKIIDAAGNENEELTKLFERTWFEEFVKLTIMSRFEGTKLIEMFDVDPETKELVTVDEIERPYFNARKGIITKMPGLDTGWLYKEGALAPYYIQVGKDKDLGMLAYLAPIVLAKKLGFGSWLDYVEKYGVPALFITTDREDDTRLKELYTAASKFKSNGFMVGRGQEKFEIGKSEGGNADNFDKLIERANSEMSKRILGGSGLTDEKSFVGSSEIQFRLAKDRFESDKLLAKNVINEKLIPRLQKLSPVYAGLKGHTFKWGEAVTLTAKEFADIVAVLGQLFELDPEEITQKTGFKIIRQKENNSFPPAPPTEEVKKKSLNGK